MNLTDDQVRALFVSDPHNESVRKELIWRTRLALLRRLPSPEGKCAGGYRVRLDDKGAMSSGYAYHVAANGMAASVCSHTDPSTGAYTGAYAIQWDTNSPQRQRLLDMLDALRDHKAAMRLLDAQLSGRA